MLWIDLVDLRTSMKEFFKITGNFFNVLFKFLIIRKKKGKYETMGI